jgi:hypothetical protein
LVRGVKQCRDENLVVEGTVENPVEIFQQLFKDKFCKQLHIPKSTAQFLSLHQLWALTFLLGVLPLLASTVERVGENKTLPVRSRLSDLQGRGNSAGGQT